MPFEAITTQEEFDRIIQERLNRKEREVRSQYSDYDELKKAKGQNDGQIAKLTKDLADANAKIKKAEMDSLRAKIAQEKDIPAELWDRLQGETEDELRKDAESLSKVFKAENRRGLPGKSTETEPAKDEKEAAFSGFLKELMGSE